jgi:hypothetical protein
MLLILAKAPATTSAAEGAPGGHPDVADAVVSAQDLGEGWAEWPILHGHGKDFGSRMLVWVGPGESSPDGLQMVWSQVLVCEDDESAWKMVEIGRFASDRAIEMPPLGDRSRVWADDDGVVYLEVAISNRWLELAIGGDPERTTVSKARDLMRLMMVRSAS